MAKLKSLSALPLLLLAVLLPSLAKAQDVNLDLTAQTVTGDHVNVTVNGCTFDYTMSSGQNTGVYMNYFGDLYKFKITSSNKKITVIELVGRGNVNNVSKPTDVNVELGGGTFDHHPGGTSVWKGTANTVQFGAASGSTYTVQRIRVWYEGTEYVPSTDEGGSTDEDEEVIMGDPIVRPASVPVNGKAVKMAIVAARQFESLAKSYALWKTQQGYDVEEVYADDYNDNGTLTGDAWAKNIQVRLKEMRPTFVLIMGDDFHVPPFKGTQEYKATAGSATTYVTDYFYGEYNDDYIPDAYVGRFSGYSADDIKAQMDKTEYMSKLSASNGSWLSNSLCIVGPDGGDTSISGGHSYAKDYLAKLGSNITDTSVGSTSLINNTINSGCGVVTYFGHGGVGDLNGNYTTYNASQLANANKYPVFLAITCLTGTFDSYECLAEKMQRMPNAGSVAYIGATRESLSWPDLWFIRGGKKENQTYLGFMRSMFPTNDEDPLNQHARTIGEGAAMGRYSIAGYMEKYWKAATEYHELFGDPTYQPYYKAPLTMLVDAPSKAVAGHIINVTAAPKAVVCISSGRNIVAVGLTDSEGHLSLKIATTAAGNYTLYCSAPNYTDWQGSINLAPNDGQEDVVDAGEGEPSDFDFDDFTHKKVLIEKFTGQNCVHCYGDDVDLKNYLNANNLNDKVFEMRHYAYTGDPAVYPYLRLTDLHDALCKTWDIKGFPNYLVDRGGGSASVNADGLRKRAIEISNGDYVGNRLSTPCQVSLSLDGSTYNPDTRQLKVVVSGKTATSTLPDLRISVFITQSGIVAKQSNYGNNYVHNGVSRAVLTNLNGDVLTTREDGTFQKTFLCTLQDKYGNYASDIDNMDVVAFVSSWDNYVYPTSGNQKDFSNSQVYNTDNANIGSLPLHAQAPVLPGDNKPYEVTIGATGFSTLYCDKDLVVPEGVTAYVAYESESGSSLITKELADGTIPAKTAVILQGTQGVHSFTVSPKKLTAYTGRNELNGTLERVSTSSLGGTIYVLAQPAGKSVGFYRYTGDMLPAHKAYFREVDGKVQGFELNFGGEGDVVTAIDRLSTVNSQLSTAYDLQGRALRQGKSAPQRGLILQNGKKLMVR